MPDPKPAAEIQLAPETLDQLRRVSTASLATLLFKRGFRNAYVQGVAPLRAAGPRMVGPAFTLRHIPSAWRWRPARTVMFWSWTAAATLPLRPPARSC